MPILMATLRRLDAGEFFPSLEDLRADVGLDVTQMRVGVLALTSADPPYLDVTFTMAGPDLVGGHVNSVSERARRELGSWPTAEGTVDRLVEALDAAAEVEQEPERKSRLKAAGSVLGGVARDITVAVISAQLTPH
jgi:hypothetical protein